MPTSLYRIRRGVTSTQVGNEFLGAIEQLANAFGALERIRAAMIQDKDGAVGDDTDWVTPATQFGFVDAAGNVSSAVAHAAFNELDSFYGNGGPALTQFCARLKQ